MKRLLFILFILISNLNFAQNFAPIGAKWYFSKGSNVYNPNEQYYTTFESTKDTVINEEICKKVIETDYSFTPSKSKEHYFLSKNDSVWFYDSNKFFLLYSFAAKKGDTLKVYNANKIPFLTTVDSVYNIDISGKQTRVLKYNSIDDFGPSFSGEVIENIGNIFYLYPTYENNINGPLRCYSDSNIGYYKNEKYHSELWNGLCCGQEWFPHSATWHYNGIYNSTIVVNIEKDTLIKDTLAQKVSIKRQSATETKELQSEFLASIGNKVYHWDRLNNEFYKIYDFDLNIGDSVCARNKLFYGSLQSSNEKFHDLNYKIIDIDTIDVNGVLLKRQFVYEFNSQLSFNTIIEKIGSIEFLLGSNILVPTNSSETEWHYDGKLRCYSDNTLEYSTEKECYMPSSIDELNEFSIKINKGICSVNFANATKKTICLIDSQGRIITQKKTQKLSDYININNDLSGLFFIVIIDETGIKTKKIYL